MTFPAYPEYKKSGIPWVGRMPAHWGELRTKNLFDLMKRPPSDKDGVVTAFRDGEVTLRSNRRTDGFTNALQEIGYQGVRCGDLVIHAMDAFAGAIGVSDSDGKSSPVYSVCRPKFGLSNSRYYGRLLRYMSRTGYIESLAKGIRERSTEFRWSEAGNVLLPVPPITEQTVIAKFLDRETAKIDALIAEQEKLIELLAEKRQATISKAVTKGLNPDAPMKDSGVEWVGEVPAHWLIESLKYLASHNDDVLPENTDDDVEISYIDIGSVSIERGIQEPQTLLFKDAPSRARRILRVGDVLVSTVRTYLRAIAPVKTLVGNMVASTGFAVLRPKSNVSTSFLEYSLQAESFISEVIARSVGVSYPAINASDLVAIKIPLPPLEEQVVIAQYVSMENDKIDSLNEQASQLIFKLKERRAVLISAAVTGKIDVRNLIEKEAA